MEANLYTIDDLHYIFEVNEDNQIKEKISNKHKVLIIDDIYKRPELVRKYLLKSSYYNDDRMRKHKESGLVGYRSISRVPKNLKIISFIHNLLVERFGVDGMEFTKFPETYRKFIFNLYGYFRDDFVKNLESNYHPHFDQGFAASIYLNTNDESEGGTAFYRNKIHDIHDLIDVSALSSLDYEDPFKWFQKMMDDELFISKKSDVVIDSDDRWELLEVIPMKYNRLVIYNGMRFHNPYIKLDWFKDYYRISQQFFFKLPSEVMFKNYKLF